VNDPLEKLGIILRNGLEEVSRDNLASLGSALRPKPSVSCIEDVREICERTTQTWLSLQNCRGPAGRKVVGSYNRTSDDRIEAGHGVIEGGCLHGMFCVVLPSADAKYMIKGRGARLNAEQELFLGCVVIPSEQLDRE
jgi:hypothetical protein